MFSVDSNYDSNSKAYNCRIVCQYTSQQSPDQSSQQCHLENEKNENAGIKAKQPSYQRNMASELSRFIEQELEKKGIDPDDDKTKLLARESFRVEVRKCVLDALGDLGV